MRSGARQEIQTDTTAQRCIAQRLTTRCVEARVSSRKSVARATLSRGTQGAWVAVELAGALGNLARPMARAFASAGRVDGDLLGHHAMHVCAGHQLLGLPPVFLRLHEVQNHSLPIVHSRPPLQAPRLDADGMRETRNGVAFQRTCEMNRHA